MCLQIKELDTKHIVTLCKLTTAGNKPVREILHTSAGQPVNRGILIDQRIPSEFMHFADTFSQTVVYFGRKQGQPVPGQIGVKGLAQGQRTLRFEPAAF